MKPVLFSLTIVATFVLQSFTAPVTPAPNFTNWDKLGQKQVNFRLEKDVIQVGVVEGLFSAIKLKVNGGDLNMHKLIVHFDNGGTQDVVIRKNIPAGGETRVIELKGANPRIIRKITMVYEKENRNDTVTVSAWGRHQ